MSGVASTRLLTKPPHPCPLPQPGERELRRAGVGDPCQGRLQNPAQPSGFTLLEILLALAILALVLSSLFSAYSETITATELVEASREVDQAARLTLAQMADDLKSLYQQEVKGDPKDSPYRFQGGSVESDGEAVEVMNFASTAHLGFDLPGPSMSVNRIAYVLKKSGEGEQRSFQLLRRERPFADFQGQGEETEVELADNVEELAVTYGDDAGTTLTEWDSASPEHNGRPPRLVQIRLKVAAGTSGGSRTFTAVVAPMAR
ncbi:MAG TPA: type II secretion system protein GspJ [Syntrophobacteria bacterium]|nr:type II secretion system protein GspJ [Syntrophobacteria bacterium]